MIRTETHWYGYSFIRATGFADTYHLILAIRAIYGQGQAYNLIRKGWEPQQWKEVCLSAVRASAQSTSMALKCKWLSCRAPRKRSPSQCLHPQQWRTPQVMELVMKIIPTKFCFHVIFKLAISSPLEDQVKEQMGQHSWFLTTDK